MNFNYEKAYCVFALPAFNNLSEKCKNVHSKLIPLVGELNQGKDLNIPITEAIKELIESLSIKEIAELSRASYFVGHWKPSLLPAIFENKKGESWKIANVCDQILRERLNAPYKIQIHEGKLRVTFSNKNCWLWDEFALATEENLQIFKCCKLPFGENSLEESANKLKNQIGDLWGNVENEPANELYTNFLLLKKEESKRKLKYDFDQKIKRLEKDRENALIEIQALSWLNEREFFDFDNVIYYSHTERFCFGWRNAIEKESLIYPELCCLLEDFPFNYDIKTV